MLVMASYSRLRLCAAHIAVRSIRARNVTIEAIAEAVAEDCSYSLWEASALAVEDSVAVASAADRLVAAAQVRAGRQRQIVTIKTDRL